jgi:Bacterial Ig domain
MRTRAAAAAIVAAATLLGSGLSDPAMASESVVEASADWQYAYLGHTQTVQATENDRCSPTHARSDKCSTSATFASLEVVDPPTLGHVVVDGRNLLYTADVDTGDDHFTYRVTDVNGVSDEAEVTMALWPAPGPPVLGDDSVEALTGRETLVEYWRNDVIPAANARADVVTQPAHGAVRVTTEIADEIYYTSDPGFTGTDSFEYLRTDELGQTDTATITVDVVHFPLPIATDRDYTVFSGSQREIPALPRVEQPADTAYTFDQPSHGTVDESRPGYLVYRPARHFAGDDAFSYTTINGEGVSATGEITMHVRPQPRLSLRYDHPTASYPSFDVRGVVTATSWGNLPIAHLQISCRSSRSTGEARIATRADGKATLVLPAQTRPAEVICGAVDRRFVATTSKYFAIQPHLVVRWPRAHASGEPTPILLDAVNPPPGGRIELQRRTPSGWQTIRTVVPGTTVTVTRYRPGGFVVRAHIDARPGWFTSSTAPHPLRWR